MTDGARLATHGWVLLLALAAAAAAPLVLHQPSIDAVATGRAERASVVTGSPGRALRDPAVAPQFRQAATAGADIVSPLQAVGRPTESLHHLGRFIWPAHGLITTYFLPYHPGIDIAAVEGSQEVAADAGQVIFAGWGSYGLYVEIDHGNGFHTVYGHMSRVEVKPGDLVSPGQEIGLMGSTGRSTGPHVHFEVRYQGTPQNPLDFLP